MFVNVQVRIFHKMTKNKQKPGNNEHESRMSQKVKLGIKVELIKSSVIDLCAKVILVRSLKKLQI